MCRQVRALGEGAFAKVVQCTLRAEGRAEDCAVKLLKPALFASDLDVADFVREGVVLRRIRHPCVSCVPTWLRVVHVQSPLFLLRVSVHAGRDADGGFVQHHCTRRHAWWSCCKHARCDALFSQ